jgi:hypothetical protein
MCGTPHSSVVVSGFESSDRCSEDPVPPFASANRGISDSHNSQRTYTLHIFIDQPYQLSYLRPSGTYPETAIWEMRDQICGPVSAHREVVVGLERTHEFAGGLTLKLSQNRGSLHQVHFELKPW